MTQGEGARTLWSREPIMTVAPRSLVFNRSLNAPSTPQQVASLGSPPRQLDMAAERDQRLDSLLESGDTEGLRAALDECQAGEAAQTVSTGNERLSDRRSCPRSS